MTRPACKCVPVHTCTVDRCSDCGKPLTERETDRSMGDYLIAFHSADDEDTVKCFHAYFQCNPCALTAAGYVVLPDGTWGYAFTDKDLEP